MPETQPNPSTFTHLWLKPDVGLELWHSLWVKFTCILPPTQALKVWAPPPWSPSACAIYFQMCLCDAASPATGKFRSTTLLGRSLLWLICAREGRVSSSFLQLREVHPLVPQQAKFLSCVWAAVLTQRVRGRRGADCALCEWYKGNHPFKICLSVSLPYFPFSSFSVVTL